MEKEIILVAGLGFGDEGKGSIVEYLAWLFGIKLIVRYNGGAQAGHNVVLPDGRHHTFSQFGSGTLLDNVKTFLSRFMLINPLSMRREEGHLRKLGISDAFQRTAIDGNALVTTPFQIAANRLFEISLGRNKHGSCGLGIGRTMADYLKYGNKVLFAKDLVDPVITEQKLEFLRKKYRKIIDSYYLSFAASPTAEKEMNIIDDWTYPADLADFYQRFTDSAAIVPENHLEKLLADESAVIFEGAQGMLLDRNFGFYPHITKTDITFANAYKLLEGAGYKGKIIRLGVFRGYMTRHGAGPFVSEDEALAQCLSDLHNPESQWQGKLRFGWLDLPVIRYALTAIGGVDQLVLTCLDELTGFETVKVCTAYEYSGDLDDLEPYFEWQPFGKKRAKITAFKKPEADSIKNGEVAKILFRCKPLEFIEFPGWRKDITGTKNLADLPKQVRKYIDFLQSKKGLSIPIKIISVGPTAEGKIEI